MNRAPGLFFVLGVLGLTLVCDWAMAADKWQPAKCPLPTRWTKDVSPANALPEYPRPQMVRKEWVNLNGLWEYAIKPRHEGLPEAFDGKILIPYPVESALSGVMKPVKDSQRLWYRRTFTVPAEWKGKRTLLHFGAVDWDATVFVNGKELGRHKGGYDGFSFDISDGLKAGDNELIVSVWDSHGGNGSAKGKQHFPAITNPGGVMYTPTTGIWQTVWMEPVPVTRIDRLIITPDVDSGEIKVSMKWQCATGVGGEGTFEAVALDGDKEIARGGASWDGQATLKIPNAKLWTPDQPNLYGLRIKLTGGDQVESYFGMRKISLGKDEKGITRILLNNKFVFQIGLLDQGFWPDGIYTAPTDEALRWDIETTKKLGMNMARKHVKIEPDRWYYWADKLGLLVWQDMAAGDNKDPEMRAQFEKELKAMIDGRYNHPSIIMWVVFNEGSGQYDTPRLTKWVKDYDPSRLVNNATGGTNCNCGDVNDVHAYPGPASPKPTETRAAVLGEFGGLGLAIPGHTWVAKSWGYKVEADAAALTGRYVKLLRKVHQFKENPGLCAAVYTQTTDVETECNGLITYDRELIKPDSEKIAAANRDEFPPEN